MLDVDTLAVFVAAALALTIVPGPAVLYIVTRSVEGGRVAGLVSALGIGAGGLVHIAFAVVGLSSLLASSAAAFAVVKWLGVAYLVWLGLSRLLRGGEAESRDSSREGGDPVTSDTKRLSGVFWQGVLVDVLNPKVALFFLAFLPQFVDPAGGAAWLQILSLGLVFAVIGLCTDALYALLSGVAGSWLRSRSEGARLQRAGRYLSSGVYLALGAAAATSGPGKN